MNEHPIELSVISPVYGSPELIPRLCERLHASLQQITENYEVILVFDCSPDDGWTRICEECKKDSRVKGLQISRNFGQHNAITAGLECAQGDWVVVMDCDLQDRPEEIPNLYAKAKGECVDIVMAKRISRSDSFFKRVSSFCFNKVFGFLMGMRTHASMEGQVCNFGMAV